MTQDPLQEFAHDNLQRLKRELDAMVTDRGRLEERIETRRKLIESLEAELGYESPRLFEALPTARRAGSATERVVNVVTAVAQGLSTGEAARRVVEESVEPLSAAEVYAQLERRGWLPQGTKDPRAAVGSALWYLAKQEKITKIGDDQNRRWARKDFASPKGESEDVPTVEAGGSS